ncbi:Aspartic peptidase A1 family protein [Dioscorea alata]|uniref:Aspartic peptidase A1 family protein n=1 Tax=Dioscorea alata TaxID=55571 RepID=A0ACB7VUZ1_DIOAL|nr:Aspartic peptidase A1 family protein [Dioscorea alata]
MNTSTLIPFLFILLFSAAKSNPVILSLRTKKIPSLALMKPPNKLLFHHNISLTVSLSVGTPPQNVSMVLDTGSELSWLLCSKPKFHPFASSSYSPILCTSPSCSSQARDLPIPPNCNSTSHLCQVSLSYADASSSSGTLATDLFRLGNSPSLPTIFGCISSSYSSSVEDSNTAGLLGMNRGALSFITQTSTRRFSYCISGRDSSGVLLLGDPSSTVPFSIPFNYTPLVEIALPLPYFDRVAYSVQLEGIRVGSVLLPIPKSVLVPDHTGAGQTMVDSGTQFSFLLGPAYDALRSEFSRQTRGFLKLLNEPDFVFQGAFDLCFRIPERGLIPRQIPPVVLMFRGAEVSVTEERLLYKVAGERRGLDAVWCFTFGNSDLVPLEAYVIGHHHQQNVWVEYDLDKSRVGFAPVRCDLASQKLGLHN